MQQTSERLATDPDVIVSLIARAERMAQNGYWAATREKARAAAERHRARLREVIRI